MEAIVFVAVGLVIGGLVILAFGPAFVSLLGWKEKKNMKKIIKKWVSERTKDYSMFFRFLYMFLWYFGVAKKLKKTGFVKDISMTGFFTYSPRIILDYSEHADYEEYLEKIRRFKRIYPKAVKSGTSTWSPYADCAICETLFLVYNRVIVAIWHKCKINEMPDNWLSPKCKYVKETKESYNLVCEK